MEMTRRNFMAAAGVAAAAAVAAPVIANADQAAPAEEAPAEDAGAVRICISCNDLDRSRDFFCGQLEFTLVGEGSFVMVLPFVVSSERPRRPSTAFYRTTAAFPAAGHSLRRAAGG